MSALSLAFVLQLAADPACTVPGMVPQFWPAVVRMESAFDPLALHDDTINQPFHPPSAAFAEKLATMLMRLGHSVGVGLSQLTARSPEQFERKFGITVSDALDPCRNMHVGARFYVTGALSTYNCGRIDCGVAYAQQVMGRIGPVVGSSQTVSHPRPCAPAWDAWAIAACSKPPGIHPQTVVASQESTHEN